MKTLRHSGLPLFTGIGIILWFSFCFSRESEERTIKGDQLISVYPFYSDYIDSINVDIWLPPGYDEDEEYAVVYMNDGQNLFDTSKNAYNHVEWGVDEILTDMLEKKSIRPTIVVGIWNLQMRRYGQYFPEKVFRNLPQPMVDTLDYMADRMGVPLTDIFSDNYLKFLVEELKPYMDENYSTHTDRDNTFITGSSMGGLISIYAVSEYPEIFGGAACLSTHWIGTFSDKHKGITNTMIEYLGANMPNPNSHKLYFDRGTVGLDSLYETAQRRVDSLFQMNGYDILSNYKSLTFDGHQHREADWRARFPLAMHFLLEK